MSDGLADRIESGDLSFLDGLVLLGYIASQRWFGAKSKDVLDARVLDAGTAPGGPPYLSLALVEVRFTLQTHDIYGLALGFRPTDEGWSAGVIAEVDGWTVYDAFADPALSRELVGLMRGNATLRLRDAAIQFWGSETLAARGGDWQEIRPMGAEQSNSSVVFDDALALKLYRRVEPGLNPELEILRFLTERGFANIAPLEGYAAYEGNPLEATLAVLQRFIPSAGDGWSLALDTVADEPDWFPQHARRLGEVTGELHTVLASAKDDAAFCPEDPSAEAIALLAASIDEEIEQLFLTLPDNEALTPIAGRGEEVRERLRLLAHAGSAGKIIRHHGDYHLGQVLWSDEGDWIVLDFEGEPARHLPERRRKRSPLRDVAGMLRSFAYAASAARIQRGVDPPPGWEERCRSAFLEGYFETIDPTTLPSGQGAIDRLLVVFELEKAIYELRYELDNRPDWASIPVAGIHRLLEAEL